MSSAKPTKLAVLWTRTALKSFDATMEYINSQDAQSAAAVQRRTKRALDLIALQPLIGTLAPDGRKRRLGIPNTGHAIEYRVSDDHITITRWARQVRQQWH